MDATFSVKDIVAKAETLVPITVRPETFERNAREHCVANRWPSPEGLRMLFQTPDRRLRLLREGDAVDPQRKGAMCPAPTDLPLEYRPVIQWWEREYRHLPPNPAYLVPRPEDAGHRLRAWPRG